MVRERLLVVAVDIDDDLSRAGVATPLYGRNEVIDAAVKFALVDPEDSDLNVLFEAVKIADELAEKGYEAIPAIVSGTRRGGAEAALRVRQELKSLLDTVHATGVVIVTDGSEDESIIPIIASLTSIYGVHRVVVKQHRGVEETYALIVNYVRKALTEPRFARMFVGVPGVILVVISALSLAGMLREALLLGLLLLGTAMAVRGFDLEDKIINVITETPVAMIAYATSTLSLLLAIGLLVSQLYSSSLTPYTLSSALNGFVSLVGFSASIAVFGHILSKLISGGLKPGREALYVVTIAVIIILLNKVAETAASIKRLDAGEFITALVAGGFALYAIGGIAVVGVTWRLARILDSMLQGETVSGQTSSPSREKSR